MGKFLLSFYSNSFPSFSLSFIPSHFLTINTIRFHSFLFPLPLSRSLLFLLPLLFPHLMNNSIFSHCLSSFPLQFFPSYFQSFLIFLTCVRKIPIFFSSNPFLPILCPFYQYKKNRISVFRRKYKSLTHSIPNSCTVCL